MNTSEFKLCLERIIQILYQETKCLNYSELDPDKTALIIVDMVNGFARQGLLQSPRVAEIIPAVTRIALNCKKIGLPTVVFADNHTSDSPEFTVYGQHCIQDTEESEVVQELKKIGGYTLINKNSTNGFLQPEFQTWLRAHPGVTNFVVVGDCTDICILQFCLTLKAHYNLLNQASWIGVPVNAVDTFDYDLHQGDLMQVFGLYNMYLNGIDVFSGFETD